MLEPLQVIQLPWNMTRLYTCSFYTLLMKHLVDQVDVSLFPLWNILFITVTMAPVNRRDVPHSSPHTPVFSAKLYKFSSEAVLPKIRNLWFGWEGPAWLHSAPIQFPHPGMKTRDTLGAERPSQSQPLLTPVVSCHGRKHSERAAQKTRLSLHHFLKSCHLTTSPVFTLADLHKDVYGCSCSDLRRFKNNNNNKNTTE